MMHELTFNELPVVAESQYLLKLQSDKIIKITGLVTAKCPHQMSFLSFSFKRLFFVL